VRWVIALKACGHRLPCGVWGGVAFERPTWHNPGALALSAAASRTCALTAAF
jgi:hypothetical protein